MIEPRRCRLLSELTLTVVVQLLESFGGADCFEGADDFFAGSGFYFGRLGVEAFDDDVVAEGVGGLSGGGFDVAGEETEVGVKLALRAQFEGGIGGVAGVVVVFEGEVSLGFEVIGFGLAVGVLFGGENGVESFEGSATVISREGGLGVELPDGVGDWLFRIF